MQEHPVIEGKVSEPESGVVSASGGDKVAVAARPWTRAAKRLADEEALRRTDNGDGEGDGRLKDKHGADATSALAVLGSEEESPSNLVILGAGVVAAPETTGSPSSNMVLVSVTDPETEPRHFTKDGDRDVLISSKESTNASKSSPLRLEANGNDTTARMTRSQSRRKQRAVTWAAIVDDMEDQRLARDEERRLQQEVAQVEENVASGGSQSTVSTMQTKQKKALPASKAGRPK
ncbi:hypothetical protein PF010_g24650 [Phytophthora fragariae]|nr:hypothetical protein PF010_g24650 [Phytophthora fragariae]